MTGSGTANLAGLVGVARAGADGEVEIGSPSIGRFTASVAPGRLVEPGDVVGSLLTAGIRRSVLVPAGVAGRVSRVVARGRDAATEWHGPLVSVRVADVAADASGVHDVGPAVADLPPGATVYRAPMDGQFYRRPAPGQAPFVSVGAVAAPGATLGLIEVMKFFYPIRLETESARRVVRCYVDDVAAVEAGQPLFALAAEGGASGERSPSRPAHGGADE